MFRVLAEAHRLESLPPGERRIPIIIQLDQVCDSTLAAQLFLSNPVHWEAFLHQGVTEPSRRRAIFERLFYQHLVAPSLSEAQRKSGTVPQFVPLTRDNASTVAPTLLSSLFERTSSQWQVHYIGIGITLVLEEWMHVGGERGQCLERLVEELLSALGARPKHGHLYSRLLELPLNELDSVFLQQVRAVLDMPELLLGSTLLSHYLANRLYVDVPWGLIVPTLLTRVRE